jgi:predicted amidophosphoribosyltransferase
MSLSHLTEHPWFDDTSNIAHQLRKIWNSVKRDISRIVSLSKEDNILDSNQEIKSLRNKIQENLRQVMEIRTAQKDISNERWNQILQKALLQAYKYRQDTRFYKDFQGLISSDQKDLSETAVHFIQAYMIKVARISKNRVMIPFKPHK